jgi:hypothetical protein
MCYSVGWDQLVIGCRLTLFPYLALGQSTQKMESVWWYG